MSIAQLAGAGSITQAAGQLYSGISQGDMYHYQAEIAAQNAKIAGGRQNYAAAATSTNTEIASLQAAQKLSGVRAGIAANNLDVNSGSAAAVQQGEREIGDINTAGVEARGAQQVYGYGIERTSAEAQENLDQSAASQAVIGGALNATGSLLSASPNISSIFGWMQNSGATGEDAASLSGSEPDASGGTFEDPF